MGNISDVRSMVLHLCTYQDWSLPTDTSILFQLANIALLAAFLTPNKVVPIGLLFMRSALIIGYMLISAWSWTILFSPDVFSWNFALMMVNLVQLVYNAYKLRPVKIPYELDMIYRKHFRPLKVPRSEFAKLVSSHHSSVNTLNEGEAYAIQNVTRTDRLSLLVSGKITALCDYQHLHCIEPGQFLDAPEFEANTVGDEKFQVSLVATETCRILTWQKSGYKFLLSKDSYLQLIMSTLIGRDITDKLYRMNSNVVMTNGQRMDIRIPSVKKLRLLDDEMMEAENDSIKSGMTITDGTLYKLMPPTLGADSMCNGNRRWATGDGMSRPFLVGKDQRRCSESVLVDRRLHPKNTSTCHLSLCDYDIGQNRRRHSLRSNHSVNSLGRYESRRSQSLSSNPRSVSFIRSASFKRKGSLISQLSHTSGAYDNMESKALVAPDILLQEVEAEDNGVVFYC